MKNEFILWPLSSSKIIVLVAQPILTDGGPPAWAVETRGQNGLAKYLAGEKGGPPSVKAAHVYVVLRYLDVDCRIHDSECKVYKAV